MFLNYSDNYRLDYCWTKNFFLRRLTVYTIQEWRFRISLDSFQPWCLSPRIHFKLGMVRIYANFSLAWWLPEIYFQASCDKLSRSLNCEIYTRRWIDNLKTVFLKNVNFKSPV